VAHQLAPAAKAPVVVYKQLNRKHREYDAELWERLRLLKKGGYEILKNAKLFVPKYPAENDDVYNFRLKQASYIGLLGKVCGYLVGSLFGESLSVNPPTEGAADAPKLPDEKFYKEFFDDCDLEDTDYSQFMRNTVYDALIFQRALVGIDMPAKPEGVEPSTRAEEEALDLGRAYLYRVDLSALINWHSVPRATKGPIKGSEFVWAVIKGVEESRDDPMGDDSKYRETFKVWRVVNGVVTWEKWRTKELDEQHKPEPDDELELVSPPAPTSFKSIPIEEVRLPEELWVGNAAGPMCEEHFRDRSMLKGDMARSLHEVGFVKQGPEMPAVHGAMPSDVQQNPNRGAQARAAVTNKGWVVIGSQDELGFAGPSGRAHELVVSWLDKVKEEVQGVVNTMALSVSNTSAAVQRSGDSKREDKSATTIILQALALCTKEAAKRVMRHVAQARAEDVEWTAGGLNTFDKAERSELVAEATEMELSPIPSPTWQREYKTNLALATLPNATPEQKRQITKEIHANITDHEASLSPLDKLEETTKRTTPAVDPADEEEEARQKRFALDAAAPPAKAKGKPPAKGAKKPAGKK
jgi:hypothetical protein